MSVSDEVSTPSLRTASSEQHILVEQDQEIMAQTPTRLAIATGDLRRDIELMREEANPQSFDENSDEHAPPPLAPPLPINPRDTVFSVISGYGHRRTHSDGVSPIVPPLPPQPGVISDVDETVPQPATATARNGNLNSETEGYRESYVSTYSESSSFADDVDEISESQDETRDHARNSTASSEYAFQPPPPIIGADDIAAIARQPSPGRVEHGIPLQSRESARHRDEQETIDR